MLNLAQRYWDWREDLDIKLQEAEKELSNKKKYKKYYNKAKKMGSMNESPNAELTNLYIECIESGVVASVKGEHYCVAKFENGYEVRFWIANKMYAYAKDSEFKKPNGEVLDFKSTMPAKWCLFYILEKIENKV